MSRIAPLLAVAALAVSAAACAPVVGLHGFQVVDVKPSDIVAGTDTKETVLAAGHAVDDLDLRAGEGLVLHQPDQRALHLQPPADLAAQCDRDHLQRGRHQGRRRRTLGLDDGQKIAMERRETPTRGRR
jgi:hypothetical protein